MRLRWCLVLALSFLLMTSTALADDGDDDDDDDDEKILGIDAEGLGDVALYFLTPFIDGSHL